MKNALYVDTMIGTVGDGQIKKSHGGGKTYPGDMRILLLFY